MLQSSRRIRGLSSPWKGFPSTIVCEGITFYNGIWEASVGEQLPREWQDGNGTDPFAVDLVCHTN